MFLVGDESVESCEGVVEASATSSGSGGVCVARKPNLSVSASPDDLRFAYESSIAAIDINWPGTNGEKSTIPPRPTVICELQRAFNQAAFGRIGVSLASYDHVIRMISRNRVPVEASSSGPLISSAIELAWREQHGQCAGITSAECRVDALRRASATTGDKAEARKRVEYYCRATTFGAAIFESVQAARAGGSLLSSSAGELVPLNAAEVVSRGSLMRVEAAACATEPPPGSSPR
jgi:hypothetical protein